MLHGKFRLQPYSPPGSWENGSKDLPCSIPVRSPLLKTLCVDTQDKLQCEANKDSVFAKKCISRFPPDFHIGVKQNRLSELFMPGVENGFAVWMSKGRGRTYFASGAYGLHKLSTTQFNGVKDTYLCFSGPGQIIPPDQRSISFKLITAEQLPMLATDDEPSGAPRV